MCGCIEETCAEAGDYGWHIGDLAIKGPTSQAPHVEVLATTDIVLPLTGEFDDKFYLLLKAGES